MTTSGNARILVIETDPVISDVITRQALQAVGFQTDLLTDTNSAITRLREQTYDVLIANLSLPGLSGKDLLVALNANDIQIPVIVIGKMGGEEEIIDAFRLGAADYLLWPMRDTEVINVVERVLHQVNDRKDKERLDRQLKQTNKELQNRVHELKTIISIGKAVTSITDQSLLFERILDGAVKSTGSDLGWFSLMDEQTKNFILVAGKNLPPSLLERTNQTWDNGASSLVSMSGETLSINGEPIQRFSISSLGKSALISPVKAQKQVVGLLVVMRKEDQAYKDNEEVFLEAIADYASISLVNARLFKALEQRARSLEYMVEYAQLGEKITNEILQILQMELNSPIEMARRSLERVAADPTINWSNGQHRLLSRAKTQLELLAYIAESIAHLPASTVPRIRKSIDLNDIIYSSIRRFQKYASQRDLTLVAEIPDDTIWVRAEAGGITQALYGLLSNAVKYCDRSGKITVRLDLKGNHAQVDVIDTGFGIDPHLLPRIFEQSYLPEQTRPGAFGGFGVRLNLIKEIIEKHGGRIWANNEPEGGSSFHFTLPVTAKPPAYQAS